MSSLRTLESLSFLVTENQDKLRHIRERNFKEVMKVTEKQKEAEEQKKKQEEAKAKERKMQE